MSAFVYGYLRCTPTMTASDVARSRCELGHFSLLGGSILVDVFVLVRPEHRLSLWVEMGARCRLARADLVVPSLVHLHQDELLAEFIRDDLEQWIGGRVLVADDPAATAGHPT